MRTLLLLLGFLSAPSATDARPDTLEDRPDDQPEDQPAERRLFSEQNSELRFSVSIVGVLRKHGIFDEFQGELSRAAGSDEVRVTLRIHSASARMKSARDTKQVQSDAFFASEQFPHIDFVSQPFAASWLRARQTSHAIRGQLSLRGQSFPETLYLQVRDCPPQRALTACSFSVQGIISRKRYGMRSHRAFVSDAVQLDVRIDAAASKPAP
jgi:polyisoprenoid-binding protein YceI